MKKLLKVVLIIIAIFVVFIIFAAINSANDDKALEELKTAQISTLQPVGELAEIFAFGTDNTDIQRENKLKEIKGSVVVWQLPVFEVERDGKAYRIQTHDPDLFGQGESIVPAIVTVTPMSDEDKTRIEALKTGDIIKFKGTIKDVRLRHIIIEPAYLYDGAPAANISAPAIDDAAKEVDAAPALTDEVAMEIQQTMAAYGNLQATFECTKAATSIEQFICNDPLLKKLDEALAYNISGMLDSDIGDIAKAEIISSQKQWLANRNQCVDGQCLVDTYKKRVDDVCVYPTVSGMHHRCRMAEEIE